MHKIFRGIITFLSAPSVIAITLALFSFSWWLGYEVYAADQHLYFPALLHALDPSVLSKDFVAQFAPSAFALYDEILIWTMHMPHMNLFYAMALWTFIARFVYFYALYKIAFYFTKNKKFSIFVLLIFVAGLRVYGAGFRTIAAMLLARDIAEAFSLLGLAWLFENKPIGSALALGFGFVVNPIMAMPFFIIFYLKMLWFRTDVWRVRIQSAIVPTLIYAAYFILLWVHIPASSFANPFFVDSLWRYIILHRESGIYISTWYYPNSSPVHILVTLFFFWLALKESPELGFSHEQRRYIKILFWVPCVLALVSLLMLDILNVSFFMGLNLIRALLLWKITAFLLFSYYAYHAIMRHPKNMFYNFALISILLSFIVGEKAVLAFVPLQAFLYIQNKYQLIKIRGSHEYGTKLAAVVVMLIALPVLIFFAKKQGTGDFLDHLIPISIAAALAAVTIRYRSEYVFKIFSVPLFSVGIFAFAIYGLPSIAIQPPFLSNAPFMEACRWMDAHTTKDDIFLTEPFSDGDTSDAIRALCLRNVFVTKKDGGAGMFKRDFAVEWWKRITMTQGVDTDSTKIAPIVKEYNVRYIFSNSALSVAFPLVFHNDAYFIYSLK